MGEGGGDEVWCFECVGALAQIGIRLSVGWNLDEPTRPIERVGLALAIVAFVLGVVCVIGAGPEAFGARYSPERRRQYSRSALASLPVTALFGLLFIRETLPGRPRSKPL